MQQVKHSGKHTAVSWFTRQYPRTDLTSREHHGIKTTAKLASCPREAWETEGEPANQNRLFNYTYQKIYIIPAGAEESHQNRIFNLHLTDSTLTYRT